ncbi:AAA family ATPase [bacterium]|nr:AAA family ATPase [bacterium]
MQKLPIGVQSFGKLREYNLIYVDKTARLLKLVNNGFRYFLSRPRRFGKSLTLSTLEAMFAGKAELFRGLAAEEWVKEQSKNPSPVLRIDMSSLRDYSTAEELNDSLVKCLEDLAFLHDVQIAAERTGSGALLRLILTLYKKFGSVVILIDEYDKPILDNIKDLAKAEEMRGVLRSFYGVLKSCDEYLRFVFITGISKFSKMGVFSAMNNLFDISLIESYSDIVGYTQGELEENFKEWIDLTASKINIDCSEILARLKDYYDGFSFDGKTRLYNPFSILNFFATSKFSNYWYVSGSSSFIVNYMKSHLISDPEVYRHFAVSADFLDNYEIERAKPESFLYQSGYLTIENWEEDQITLNYPNVEVYKSITRMYLEDIYKVESYISLGSELWKTLSSGKILEATEIYNRALAGIPYEDFAKRDEYWYRSLFLMLLRGAGITAFGEIHTHKGRSDLLIKFPQVSIILEFKFAKKSSEVEQKIAEGKQQLQERDYAKGYGVEGCEVVSAVVVADDERHQVCCKL